MAYCPKCGSETADDDEFCRKCGFSLNEEKEMKIVGNDNNKLLLIPLVVGIIGILVGIAEGLSCPVLFGEYNIYSEMIMAILGGLMGIYLYQFADEPLIAGIEFILTGIIMAFEIGNMAIIGCIIFIIAGISSIFLTKDLKIKSSITVAIPILTAVIPILLLLVFAGVGAYTDSTLANEVTVSNVINDINYGYGYYSGDLEGDISLNTDFDYIEMDIEYYDADGKVLYSGLVWNENNAASGKTYHFSSPYFKEQQPVRAEITLTNSALDDNVFYRQNITLE